MKNPILHFLAVLLITVVGCILWAVSITYGVLIVPTTVILFLFIGAAWAGFVSMHKDWKV